MMRDNAGRRRAPHGYWAGPCLLLCWVTPAQALPRLHYDVPAQCPDAEWFVTELRKQDVPMAADGALHVSVMADGATDASNALLHGQLRYAQNSAVDGTAVSTEPAASTGAEPTWQRELPGQDCSELLSGLALSFAVYWESRSDGTRQPLFDFSDEPLPPVVEPAWAPMLDYAASARWRLGLIAGLELRGGLAPNITASWSSGLHLRGVRAGWAAGPFELGFSQMLGPRRASVPSAVPPRQHWDQRYWVVHVLATPWMHEPHQDVRLGPALAWHGGRFGATVSGETEPAAARELWFSFLSVLLLAEMHRGALLVRAHAGFQLPIDPYEVKLDSARLYHQELGLVVGLGLGWSGVLL